MASIAEILDAFADKHPGGFAQPVLDEVLSANGIGPAQPDAGPATVDEPRPQADSDSAM